MTNPLPKMRVPYNPSLFLTTYLLALAKHPPYLPSPCLSIPLIISSLPAFASSSLPIFKPVRYQSFSKVSPAPSALFTWFRTSPAAAHVRSLSFGSEGSKS